MITPDCRYYIQNFASYSYAKIYRINDDGSLTYTNQIGPVSSSESIAITPDGNYVLIVNEPYPTTTKLSTFRLYHDGTSQRLKDMIYYGYFSDVKFIPPQVLAEWGATGEEWATFDDWTTAGATAVFNLPAFDRTSSGTLTISTRDNTNTFGFWVSPADDVMVVPYSLYRARYLLRHCSTEPEPRLPTVRLRFNAQTFHQADELVLSSNPTALPMPGDDWTTFDLLFEPPVSSCSRPEERDDLYASLDVYSFNFEEDIGVPIELERVLVDRVPVDMLTTKSLVRDYTFSDSTEGWIAEGAPGTFDMPIAAHQPGRLSLTAVNSTNCFGYWTSPDDIETSTGAELYRIQFAVSTDVTDRTLTPSFRLRLNTADLACAATQTIESRGDGEMSPYLNVTQPGKLFIYNLYFYKPVASEPSRMQISFDLINLTPEDATHGTLNLDRCTIHTLAIPHFPEDDYF